MKPNPVNNEENSNNVDESFSKLIGKYEFFIPSYQRAYSWTEKQVSLFINDLAEHAKGKTQYYLGHYILESKRNWERIDGRIPVDIVDGQQRLTTVVIFLAVCRGLRNMDDSKSLRLSVVKYDKKRFEEMLLPDTLKALASRKEVKETTASLERVVFAIQTFYKAFFKNQSKSSLLLVEEIDAYIDVISKAAVSVGVYESKAVAAQIFELHNTRGVLLTETEKVKALLMKYVYLQSGEDDVSKIQKSFSEVFELEEQAASVSFRGKMSLDDILAHHLRAVDDGGKNESFTQPQSVEGESGCLSYVRKRLDAFSDLNEGVSYAKNLAREFAESMNLIGKAFVEQDVKEPLIGDVILLDQRRSMIFLLRYFRALKIDSLTCPDHILLKRWESFLFLWNCHDAFYNMKAAKKDSFKNIFVEISEHHLMVADLLESYFSGRENFAYRPFSLNRKAPTGEEIEVFGLSDTFKDYIDRHKEGLLSAAHRWSDWHGRFKYWIYKYEIVSADAPAGSQENQTRISLRKLFKENDVTLDHIVPKQLDWRHLSKNEIVDNDLNKWDFDDRSQAEETWRTIGKTIDGIGNLVILSRSQNATLQNIAPFERGPCYKSFDLGSISYREVSTWKPRSKWNDDKTDPWQYKIEERGQRLLTWMKDYFTAEATWKL